MLSGHNGFASYPSEVIAACLHRSEAEVERLTLQFDAALPDDIEMLDLIGRLAVVEDVAPSTNRGAPHSGAGPLADELGMDAREEQRVGDAVLAAVANRGRIVMDEVKLLRADLAGYHGARERLASVFRWSETDLYIVLGPELEIDLENAQHAGDQVLEAKIRKALFEDLEELPPQDGEVGAGEGEQPQAVAA